MILKLSDAHRFKSPNPYLSHLTLKTTNLKTKSINEEKSAKKQCHAKFDIMEMKWKIARLWWFYYVHSFFRISLSISNWNHMHLPFTNTVFLSTKNEKHFFSHACIVNTFSSVFFHLVIVIWCVCKICFGKNLLIICDNMTSDSWYIHRIKNNKAKITDLLFSAPEKKLDSRVQYCEHIKKTKERFSREKEVEW